MVQAELHCHTKEVSICGCVPAEELVRLYHEKDYRVLVITDHYYENYWNSPRMRFRSWDKKIDQYLTGYKKAKAAGEALGMTVLFGLEVQFDNFKPYDFLIYGPDEAFLREHEYLNCLTAECHALVKSHGFLMYQAHPYRYGKAPVEPIVYDGIEAYNAHPRHNSHNKLAVQFAFEHGLGMIAGSDAHRLPDIGRGGIMVPESVDSMPALVAYLKQGIPELIITYEEAKEGEG